MISLFFRYLIVVDDIWDETAWNIINYALPKDRNNSTVITTTRIDNVARACCSNQCGYVYRMNPLSNQDSRRLFFTRIFGSEDACPLFLEKVSVKILKRCGGLPLAIITISSLLACQRNQLKEQWEQILNSLGFNMELHPTLEGMRQILNLSYIHLPRYLKTCMLYLGIYPEDRVIEKNDLVRQWVAQGFISTANGQDQEDVAEGYFNELVNRSIVQPSSYRNGHAVSCIVHDMMLDLIIHKCRDENFILAIDDLHAMTGLHDKVRRLSLNLDGVIDGTIMETICLSQVRALARFGTSTYAPPLMEFKHLRVLSLDYLGRYQESGIFDLGGICHLFQLRYLKIEAHGEIVLPSKIRGLQQLETLEIDSCGSKVQVPSDIVHLRRLLHLIIHGQTVLPDGIGNMKSLSTLGRFDFGMNSLDVTKGLGELTNLRDLRISCTGRTEITMLLDGTISIKEIMDGVEARSMDALRSSIGKLCNLKYLSVDPPLCTDYSEFLDALSSVYPSPSHLQRLDLLYCQLTRVPKWIRDLHNLYKLDLVVHDVLRDDVGILAQLPSLTHLYLHIEGIPREKVVISRTGFPVLKYLTVGCSRASALTFEVGAMPRLQWLKIYFDTQLWHKYGGAPSGIEHLSGLKKIYVRIGCSGDDYDIRAAESALRNAIDVHPGRPVAEIDRSGLCSYFDKVKDQLEDENVNTST
jgi:Leucine-rich repeat (LRR) protein